MTPSARRITAFRAAVLAHHAANPRGHMPWRETSDPYRVLVSEVMLQQTQVGRVLPYYEAFLAAFPDVLALANAPLAAVLAIWQGLGYNRRAVALKRAAEEIVATHGGEVPRALEDLLALPGIGPATAAGVRAFAFGEPGVYIETNVRAALIHDFFPDAERVTDRELLPVYEAVLDHDDPRSWLYALMDYGAHVKREHSNPSRRSAHHAKQSKFEGSVRQMRGRILADLLENPDSTAEDIVTRQEFDHDTVVSLLDRLAQEGFLVAEESGRYRIS